MTSRDLANARIALWLGSNTSVADLSAPTLAEIGAMLPAYPAARFDGYDFGMQASDQTDDRSLADTATATTRSFSQFGGAIPFFWPKAIDTTSILRQVFNLVKVPQTPLIIVERVGFKAGSAAIAPGDNVNCYRVIADGFKPDLEGTGGYAYITNMLPAGDVYPWTIVPAASPAAVAITGGATATLSLAGVNIALRGATYQGNNIGNRAVWLSSNPAVATVDNHGVIRGVSIGSANITANFPGGAVSTACAVTVGA